MSPLARTAGLLFLLGATLGVFFDALHVVSHTTEYADPGMWGQPWWVPPLFGAAAMAMGMSRALASRAIARPPIPASGARAIVAMALFFLAYAESAFLPGELAQVALAVTVAALFLFDVSLAGAAVALLSAILGPLAEIAMVWAGAFRYVDQGSPMLSGVPVWLPLLYVCAALAVGTVARWHARA